MAKGSAEQASKKQEKKNEALDLAVYGVGAITVDAWLTKEGYPPLAEYATGLYGVAAAIKAKFFGDKLLLFMRPSGHLQKEVKVFFEQFTDPEAYKRELLLTIERLTIEQKAEIIGNLFKAVILNEIGLDEFERLVSVVEVTFIEDLQLIRKRFADSRPEPSELDRIWGNEKYSGLKLLVGSGLVNEKIVAKKVGLSDDDDKTELKFEFELSKLGRKLAQYGF